MAPNLSLSRYLYCKSDIKLSIINCLIKKLSFDETLYWFTEWYISGWDCFELIWQIYYDFYAIVHPKFESYINKKEKAWLKNNDIYIPLTIVKNLFQCHSNPMVFMLRQYIDSFETYKKGFKIEKQEKMKLNYFKCSKDSSTILKKFQKGDWKNVCILLKKMKQNKNDDDFYKIYREILLISNQNEKKIEKMWKNKGNCKNYHFILAIFAIISQEKSNVKKKKIKILLNKEEKSLINTYLDISISLDKYGNKQIYNTLPIKRLYNIHHKYGNCFNTIRNSIKYNEFIHENLYYWEFHTKDTPFWNSLYKKYKCTMDLKDKIPKFKNEDLLEEFYENYNYELDEQKKSVQNASIKKYDDDVNYIDWLDSLYSEYSFPISFDKSILLSL
jgi:hypothetical protein